MATIGIKDVARTAGVSVGTVSNVLNRPDTVREETRFRVQAVIAQLGFVRNESARQLRAGRSRSIGYVFLDASNPFFTDVARGVEEAAETAGLGLFLCNSNGDSRRESHYLELLQEQRVVGILITPIDYTNPQLAALGGQGIPVVVVDNPANGTGSWCSVGVDDLLGGELAITHLLEEGHKRIGFAGGPLTLPQLADRLGGVQKALADAGRPAGNLTLLETETTTMAAGREAAQRLLGLPARRRPTALFCCNDLVALGALQQFTVEGVPVPDAVAIVGYDDIDFAAGAAVPLTSVRQPREQLGRTATQMLLTETTEDGHRHRHITFSPELIVRASSRRARRRASA